MAPVVQGLLGVIQDVGHIVLDWGSILPYSAAFWWWRTIYILTHSRFMGIQEASSTNTPHCQSANCAHLQPQTWSVHFRTVTEHLVIISKWKHRHDYEGIHKINLESCIWGHGHCRKSHFLGIESLCMGMHVALTYLTLSWVQRRCDKLIGSEVRGGIEGWMYTAAMGILFPNCTAEKHPSLTILSHTKRGHVHCYR